MDDEINIEKDNISNYFELINYEFVLVYINICFGLVRLYPSSLSSSLYFNSHIINKSI